jgi:hypothetical protein
MVYSVSSRNTPGGTTATSYLPKTLLGTQNLVSKNILTKKTVTELLT